MDSIRVWYADFRLEWPSSMRLILQAISRPEAIASCRAWRAREGAVDRGPCEVVSCEERRCPSGCAAAYWRTQQRCREHVALTGTVIGQLLHVVRIESIGEMKESASDNTV